MTRDEALALAIVLGHEEWDASSARSLDAVRDLSAFDLVVLDLATVLDDPTLRAGGHPPVLRIRTTATLDERHGFEVSEVDDAIARALAGELPPPPTGPGDGSGQQQTTAPRPERVRVFSGDHHPPEDPPDDVSADVLRAAELITRELARDPALVDRRRVADALIAEVGHREGLAPIGVFVPADDGYELLVGMPVRPARRVESDQPMFDALTGGSDAVLVVPGEDSDGIAGGLLDEVPPSLAVVAVRRDSQLLAALLVGGDDVPDATVGELITTASRYATRFAIAEQIERIRRTPLVDLSEPIFGAASSARTRSR